MRRALESFLRRRPALLDAAYRARRWLAPLLQSPVAAVAGYLRFFRDRRAYLRAGGEAALVEAYPCLFDLTSETKIDPQYFHQAVWAARHIVAARADEHVDVGSDTKYVGMLAAWMRVIFVDIRPLAVSVDNLECRAGSVLDLPFPDRSIASLSSLHVIEHIGLGRYGDPIDPQGTAKACRELQRVLAAGGRLYLSTPVGRARVQFNGQRVQTVADIVASFPELRLVELALVDPHGRFLTGLSPADAERQAVAPGGLDYSLGCFVFVRREEVMNG